MKRSIRSLGGLAVLLLLSLADESASGATMDIRAVFRPDPAKPMHNEFINMTPVTGHCASNPAFCKAKGLFSLVTPIGFQSVGAIEAGHDPRSGPMFRVPGDWRRLSVRHADTREEAEVEVRIVSIGGRYVLSDTAEKLVGEGEPTSWQYWHARLLGDWTWAPPAPCIRTGGMYTSANTRTFFWLTSGTSVCAARANYRIPGFTYDRVQIGYELRTPDPLKMSSGQYNGDLTYTVGPGMDFDMGDIMQPDDSVLTLSFNLDVEHTLKVDLPPGANKVALEPEGGWNRWIESGRKPTRIYRDQLFYISASSRFNVMMQCDSPGGTRCYLRGEDGSSTQVEARLSLPAGINGPGNEAVNQVPLVNNVWVGPFQPGHYLDRKPGSLRFEMPRDAIDFLIRPGFSGTLRGNITIIWDSEV